MKRTRPSRRTRSAERRDAAAPVAPDRDPTPSEESAAAERPIDPKAAAHAHEMYRIGASEQGEGRIP